MKRQYLGDVNDYRKYCILRRLADGGSFKVGVCWMLTPDDQGPDGRKTSYLADPKKWRHHDEDLFDSLRSLVETDDQRLLHRIESGGLIPGAAYFDDLVPDERAARISYTRRALEALNGVDLIFFDPDNGIEIPSKPKGRKGSSKFVFWDELIQALSLGHSVLVYQHFPRRKRDLFTLEAGQRFLQNTNASQVWALQTANVVFFLAVHLRHVAHCQSCLQALVAKAVGVSIVSVT